MSFFGLGRGGVKVEIVLDGPSSISSSTPGSAFGANANNNNNNSNNNSGSMMIKNDQIVPMHHTPSWKLRKNPFWRIGNNAIVDSNNNHNNNNNNNSSGGIGTGAKILPTTNYNQQQSYYDPSSTSTASVSSFAGATSGPQSSASSASASASSFPPHVVYAYEASQNVQGSVIFTLPPGKKADHLGIKIQFIGRIDMGHGVHEGRPHYDFISLSKELSPPGSIYQSMEIPFLFKNMDKEYESYTGRNVSVRYFVKVIMERKFLPPMTKEQTVWVQICGTPPPNNEAIKMEVGIEDCLHIEFEYERRAYHLQDVICGKIHFLLVRIKIKHMELAVIRRETSGEGVAMAAAAAAAAASTTGAAAMHQPQPQQGNQNIFTETQTLVKYEIMDGCPFAKDIIPVRLHLEGIPADLTPTYTAINNRFSVRYYLNLVLVDEEDRRYFKQQEIILWRKNLG